VTPVKRHRAWRPGKQQRRVDNAARRLAESEALRIPWPQLAKARELYLKWQAFVDWVRAIEEAEGCLPQWIFQAVNKRCPGFQRFEEQRHASDPRSSSPRWGRLEQWVNERIFARPRREGWTNAVGYYAVRDLAALRVEAYWYYCERHWVQKRPASYPSFLEWCRASERAADEVFDAFETIDELRGLIKLSRRVSPRTLTRTVDQYVEWQVFAHWVRIAFDRENRLPKAVKRELRRRCPGFLETVASSASGDGEGPGKLFNLLLCWVEEHEFARPHTEGWLQVLLYQARLHPRYQRALDYWHHHKTFRANRQLAQYVSFERWRVALDSYTFGHVKRNRPAHPGWLEPAVNARGRCNARHARKMHCR
jgi:hypothetical protein